MRRNDKKIIKKLYENEIKVYQERIDMFYYNDDRISKSDKRDVKQKLTKLNSSYRRFIKFANKKTKVKKVK